MARRVLRLATWNNPDIKKLRFLQYHIETWGINSKILNRFVFAKKSRFWLFFRFLLRSCLRHNACSMSPLQAHDELLIHTPNCRRGALSFTDHTIFKHLFIIQRWHKTKTTTHHGIAIGQIRTHPRVANRTLRVVEIPDRTVILIVATPRSVRANNPVALTADPDRAARNKVLRTAKNSVNRHQTKE